RTWKGWQEERQLGRSQVAVAEYEFNKRRCWRVEVSRPDRTAGKFYCYRNVLYFDKETSLPVRVESYDWPRPGGPPAGELLEVFSFLNVQTNVGLDDRHFSY